MTPEEQERTVGDLEIALDRLQALYNQYFMGIEKLEPLVQRKDVERKINALRKEKIRNTAVRFRLQTQIQKYNTQSTYWKRICRQIEEGTYKRDVMRAMRRSKVRDEHTAASEALASLDDASRASEPPAYDISGAGLDIDDPFSEAPAAARERADAIGDLDDPFADPKPIASSTPPAEPAPGAKAPVPHRSFAGDPDKTPVPIAGSGVHNLREKLIEDTKLDAGKEDVGELAEFFSRRSIPPPPPSSVRPPPPRPPLTSSRAAPPRPKGAKAPPRPAKPTASGPAAGPAGVNEDRMKAIFRAYVSARKQCNENANVSYDKVTNLLKKQMAANGNVRDFKVVIRDGKAVIKTVK